MKEIPNFTGVIASPRLRGSCCEFQRAISSRRTTTGIRVAPPLCLTQPEADESLAIMQGVLQRLRLQP